MKLLSKMLLIGLFSVTTLITACREQFGSSNEQSLINQQQPDIQNPMMLAEFNRTVQIKTLTRHVVKNENNHYGTSFTYKITNLSSKPIKSIKWLLAYKFQNEILHTHPFKLNFAELLTPTATFSMNFIIPEENLPKNTRSIFLDSNNQINSLIIGREIEFSDGSKIIVEN